VQAGVVEYSMATTKGVFWTDVGRVMTKAAPKASWGTAKAKDNASADPSNLTEATFTSRVSRISVEESASAERSELGSIVNAAEPEMALESKSTFHLRLRCLRTKTSTLE